MASGDPSKVATPLAEVLTEISKGVVAARLEALFPGFERYATQQNQLSGQRRQATMGGTSKRDANLVAFVRPSVGGARGTIARERWRTGCVPAPA